MYLSKPTRRDQVSRHHRLLTRFAHHRGAGRAGFLAKWANSNPSILDTASLTSLVTSSNLPEEVRSAFTIQLPPQA